jgi:hypothetical protein
MLLKKDAGRNPVKFFWQFLLIYSLATRGTLISSEYK